MNVKCPTCQTQIEWTSAALFRPFCSKRCQLIDLGQWADEKHTIAGNEHKQDMLPDNIDVEDIEAMLLNLQSDKDGFFNS